MIRLIVSGIDHGSRLDLVWDRERILHFWRHTQLPITMPHGWWYQRQWWRISVLAKRMVTLFPSISLASLRLVRPIVTEALQDPFYFVDLDQFHVCRPMCLLQRKKINQSKPQKSRMPPNSNWLKLTSFQCQVDSIHFAWHHFDHHARNEM